MLDKLFDRLPDNRFFRVIRCLVRRYFTYEVNRSAAALTYYFIFNIFPLLSLASGVIALMELPPIEVTSELHTILPAEVITLINGFLGQLGGIQPMGLILGSGALALYFTVRSVDYLVKCVGDASGTNRKRSWLQHIIVVAIFTVSLPVVMLAAVILMVVGERLLTFLAQLLPIAAWGIDLWTWLRFLVLGALLMAVLGLLYWLGPGVRVPLRQVVPGVLVAGATWLVVSAGFSFYVENMGRYSVIYGSIGAIIVLMLWIYFSALILLMGAQFNQALRDVQYWKRKEESQDSER